jgi:hypothetical protein
LRHLGVERHRHRVAGHEKGVELARFRWVLADGQRVEVVRGDRREPAAGGFLLGDRLERPRAAAVVVGCEPAGELVAHLGQRDHVADRVGRLPDRQHDLLPEAVLHPLAAVLDRRSLDQDEKKRCYADGDQRVARAQPPRLAGRLGGLWCADAGHVRRRSR